MAAASASLREETITVDTGAQLFVQTVGSGPPVVLIHGNFVSSRMWAPQLPALAQHYTVIAYDARGFGRSPVLGGRRTAAEDLDALLRALGHESAHIVGSSMGGSIGLEFALLYPERVRSLVIGVGGISGWEPPAWMVEGFAGLEAAIARRDFVRARDLIMDFPPMRTLEQQPSVRQEVVEMFDQHRWEDSWEGKEPPEIEPSPYARLADVQVPTLLVNGSLDDPSFLALAEEMQRQMPRADQILIPGAGHMVNMEAADEFNAVLLDFLRRAEAI